MTGEAGRGVDVDLLLADIRRLILIGQNDELNEAEVTLLVNEVNLMDRELSSEGRQYPEDWMPSRPGMVDVPLSPEHRSLL